MGAPELTIDGRFEILERVGKGSFGEVLRGRDRRTGEIVAIKRLLDDDADDAMRERFQREASYLSRISSPNVVRCLAKGPDATGRPCIVLEWLDGTDLAYLLRRGPLPVTSAVDMARRAALGLAAVHEQGIVHRDVKPANFFLIEEPSPFGGGTVPNVKLIDLGIARSGGDRPLTEKGSRLGTPVYMSPEQARGEEHVTAASDLFSLGIVLYELVAGKRPFAGDRTLIVLAKIVLHDPPPLEVARPDVPPELSAIVSRALAKSIPNRYRSAFEMVDDLGQLSARLARRSAPLFSWAPLPAWAQTPADPSRPASGIEPKGASGVESSRDGAISGRGEQRVITAVFADLGAAADKTAGRLAIELATSDLGGVSYGTLGHQVIAVFGRDQSEGDEALRGARLALSVRARVPGMRLAIATSRARWDETGLSADVIERGSALRSKAAEDVIVLDAPTARLVGGHVAVEEIEGGFALRGELEPHPSLSPRLLGRPSPMVGRERELVMLEALFDNCVDTPIARAALVTGPAGAGKSRLRYELSKRLSSREPSPVILLGRGESLRAGSPYAMIADLIRRAAGIVEGEPGEVQLAKIEARVRPSVSPVDVQRVVDFLGELAMVPPVSREPSPALRAARADPALMGDAMRMSFEDWILAECARAPVVIILEDLQWGDLATVKLASQVIAGARTSPLFLLALARAEVHEHFPSLSREQALEEFRLTSLGRAASERLAREVLGPDVEQAVVRLVAERAGGNAFYLEEMIRAVAEGKEGLPDSVLGLVQARLDELGQTSKHVLRAASIFGERFSEGGVVALCGGDAALVSGALDELVAREVLVRKVDASDSGLNDLGFRSALVREAAYAMLEPLDLELGHRLAAAFLVSSGETDAALVATHYERGGEPERATGSWLRAAELALVGNDFDAALSCAERGAARASGETLGMFRLILAEASRWKGDAAAGLSWAKEATSLLPAGSASYFRAVGEILSSAGRLGAWEEVEFFLDQALSIEAAKEARSAQIAHVCPAATYLLQAGRNERAVRVTERVLGLARLAKDLDPHAMGRIQQLKAFRALGAGDLAAARRGYVSSMALFESAGYVRQACVERINLGHVCAELGDLERAEEVLATCLQASQRMRLGSVEAACFLNLARVYSERGRIAEAERCAERAEELGRAQSSVRIVGTAELYRSVIAHRRGAFVLAEELALRALSTLEKMPPMAAGAMACRARALVRIGRSQEALAEVKRAIAIVEGGGHETLANLVRLVFAEVLWAVGAKAEARAAIGRAKALILKSADRIGDPDLRRSFLEVAETNARTIGLAVAWGV